MLRVWTLRTPKLQHRIEADKEEYVDDQQGDDTDGTRSEKTS